jgi:hypothetical protein
MSEHKQEKTLPLYIRDEVQEEFIIVRKNVSWNMKANQSNKF